MKIILASAGALALTAAVVAGQTTPAAATAPAAAAAAPATFNTYTAPGIMFGAWMDTTPGRDTPVALNQRLGFNLSLVHLSENLPIDFNNPPPTQLLDQTYTDAILYLSVIPATTPDAITDTQIDDLAKQLGGYTTNGRTVILRLGAEMNGNWQPYGQLPVAFKAFWLRVWTAVRAIPANVPPATGRGGVSFLWAPNPMGNSYPWHTANTMTAARNATEFAALDTNNDGVFDGQDDGYSPFYPGSQYVDWVGLSTYWFGTTSPYRNNVVAQPGYMEQYCHGLAAGGFGPDFYNVYAVGDDKPFFVAEGGAALHEYMIANTSDTANLGAIAVGPGEVALKQSWWQEYLTNATFLEAHPRLKAVSLFEWEKPEEVTMRDFRISHAPAVLAAFKADFSSAGIMSRYTLGGYADIVTDPSLNPNQTVPVRPVPVPTVSTPVAGSGTAPSSVSPSASNVPKPSGIEIEKSAAAGRGASVAVGAIAAAIAVAFLV